MTATAAIVGSGNIGTDLMYKLQRSSHIEPRWMIGVDPDSAGLRLATEHGLETSAEGVDWLLAQDELPDLVFEATSAYVHVRNAPRYREAGIRAIDLTPAAVGPVRGPAGQPRAEHVDERNVNMVTCGGQATIPMVAAVSARVRRRLRRDRRHDRIEDRPGRAPAPNIDEFTQTTASARRGARRRRPRQGDHHPQPGRTAADHARHGVLLDSRRCRPRRDRRVDPRRWSPTSQGYVPGYRLKRRSAVRPTRTPVRRPGRVGIFLEVEGAGDYLPNYAGNLDIMTAAATQVGNGIAQHLALAGAPSPSQKATV